MLVYEGIFFEGESLDLIRSLEKEQLQKINDEIHCTFRYHPSKEEIFNELVGHEIEVFLIGYGHDSDNSGFLIQLPTEIEKYYINYLEDGKTLIIPHITSSLSGRTKASKTRELDFKPLDKPYLIKGKFGFWIKEDDHEYLSYEPYDMTKVI